jgi:tetratricopeptide (TPR) repeat protein
MSRFEETDEDVSSLPDPEAQALDRLGERFLRALNLKDAGKVDEAEDGLRALIAEEPRLGEPRIELARLLLDTERLTEAEEHAREGLAQLQQTGAWTDDIPANVVLGLAHALLAEVLRRRADDDDVIFGDPDAFRALVEEAKQHFEKAAALDPGDEYASYHAFFLGVKGHGAKVDFGDGITEDDA